LCRRSSGPLKGSGPPHRRLCPAGTDHGGLPRS
jgi:hypothetical protein